jgi:hypothetical protein
LTADRYDCGSTLPPIDFLSISPSGDPVYLALGYPSIFSKGIAAPRLTASDPQRSLSLPTPAIDQTPPVVLDAESNASFTSSPSLSQRISTPFPSSACGQPDSPWLFTVKPGQRLTVTLIDFDLLPASSVLPLSSSFPVATGNGSSESSAQSSAVVYNGFCSGGQRTIYAVIGERDVGLNITVCGGPISSASTSAIHSDRGISGDIDSEGWNFNEDYHSSLSRVDVSAEKLARRQRVIYESVGHVIEIRLPSAPTNAFGASFGGRTTFHQPRQRRYGFIFRLDGISSRFGQFVQATTKSSDYFIAAAILSFI